MQGGAAGTTGVACLEMAGGTVAGRQFLILVGVNTAGSSAKVPPLSFAEVDAKALYDTLTDEVTGAFDPADAHLLLGSQATTRAVKVALRDAAISATPSDMLFVYFAGHALLSESPPHDDPYLLTSDLDIEEIKRNPDSGLRMSFVRRDVFEVMPGSSYLILDCCHAGGFAEFGRREPPARSTPLLDAVERIYERLPARQSALFACPPDRSARESRDLGHGVLTHSILRALTGEAAGDDGSVNFDQLVRYVCEQDINPKPGFFSQGWGSGTVVTRPGIRDRRAASQPTSLDRRIDRLALTPCTTPMDASLSTLEQLLDRLFNADIRALSSRDSTDATPVLDHLRAAVEARGVAEVSVSSTQLEILGVRGDLQRDEITSFVRQLVAKASRSGESTMGHIGTSTNGHRRLLGVHGQLDGRGRILVFADVPAALLDLGELLAVTLGVARSTLLSLPKADAEVAVITALRERFGRVPVRLYRRSLAAYRGALDSVTMVFEPVISLSGVPSTLGIYSWEALARRTANDRSAPVGLLQVAASWTDEFLVARDTVLATKAIAGYAAAHRDGPWGHDGPKPVSINVSVRALLEASYVAALQEAISEAGLGHFGVTLEISEHDAIAPYPGEAEWWKPDPNRYFQSRLRDIVKRLRVNFAIDDFGVGHASLDRIASFSATQIKVDRAILHHPLALDELDLVVKLANDASGSDGLPKQRIVVVEGFDRDSPIPLYELYAHGIRHVQGYIAEEPASQQLRPLSQDLRSRIASLTRRPHHEG
jgi:EAL domain-containing protein (putative c-di-GMP-specific phosphodiesterase class I)